MTPEVPVVLAAGQPAAARPVGRLNSEEAPPFPSAPARSDE